MNQGQEMEDNVMIISIDGRTIELHFTQESHPEVFGHVQNILFSSSVLNAAEETVDAA